MGIIFCAYRDWSLSLYEKLRKKHKNMVLVNSPKKLTLKFVKKINPDYLFFPDWSWIIPKDIVNNYKCICIHESSLPKFRGGSPIQNQIIRNITKTHSTAFFMDEGIDTGDIVFQKPLSLEGSISEIFTRMINNDYQIINNIIKGKFKRRKQKGTSSKFKRRTPIESELKTLNHSKKYLYNFIRMLDDPYPNAFIKIGKRKIIFKSVEFNGNTLSFSGELL